jgi:hypothetical protein
MMSDRAVELFKVYSRVDDLHGYKNVCIAWFVVERDRPLFGAGGALGCPYARGIVGYDPGDEYRHYCEGAVEELFTADEAQSLVEWLRDHRNDATATIEPAELPIPSSQMAVGAQPVGGETDFLTVDGDMVCPERAGDRALQRCVSDGRAYRLD